MAQVQSVYSGSNVAQNEDIHVEKATNTDQKTSDAAKVRFAFPNLAWESVQAGLGKERVVNNQLNEHIKEAEKIQKDIDLLLDCSSELTAHKDDDKQFSEKETSLLAQLKERGIELWKGAEGALSKEKISELKSLCSSQVDKLRANLQIVFTTKIQFLIQTVSAIMETLKDIIRNNSKLISTANRLPGH